MSNATPNIATDTNLSNTGKEGFPKNEPLKSVKALISPQEWGVIEEARAIIKRRYQRQSEIEATDPALAKTMALLSLGSLEHEAFGLMLLDTRHRLIESTVLFHGTIDACGVYPRDVVAEVIQHHAAAVIFFHNHPSGSLKASQADRRITRRLTDALALIDVRVLDHLIVGDDDCLSFADHGWI